MVFYEPQTTVALVIAVVPAMASVYFFIRQEYRFAVILLLCTAFLLRILMIMLDPFLHEWDERYHALVAKHVMETPLTPRLFPAHIMAFDINDWGYNHIWVHKQPVFLWQMAIFMKLFGINFFALRLPSAIMGTIMVWMTYDIGRRWTASQQIGYIAAFFMAVGNYGLELVSGRYSLDHNDVAFSFYVTASIWAFVRYTQAEVKTKWTILVGLFAGLAIMNKWLTGLLVFGAWFVFFLLSPTREKLTSIRLGLLSIGVCLFVFLPWQVYIWLHFPEETRIMHAFNSRHIAEDLGHPGNVFAHFTYMEIAYHMVLLVFAVTGMAKLIILKENRKLTMAMLAILWVLVLFFSMAVKTKMPSYTYPAVALVYTLSATGLVWMVGLLLQRQKWNKQVFAYGLAFTTIVLGFLTMRPGNIVQYRALSNTARNTMIENAGLYGQIGPSIPVGRVVLNCRSYQNINLMFHSDAVAYHYYPPEEILDSLQHAGHRFAAFDYPCDHQELPTYIMNDTSILILQAWPK